MINIVLYGPEKPLNTGSVMRTISATNTMLHIIGPLTYEINDKNLKRAGLDYIKKCSFKYYDNLEHFLIENNNPEIIYITRYGKKSYDKINFKNKNQQYFVMFGKESSGIPRNILKENIDKCYRIPMEPEARSLNLSNSVAIVLYEALRQQEFPTLISVEGPKGENFLDNC